MKKKSNPEYEHVTISLYCNEELHSAWEADSTFIDKSLQFITGKIVPISNSEDVFFIVTGDRSGSCYAAGMAHLAESTITYWVKDSLTTGTPPDNLNPKMKELITSI